MKWIALPLTIITLAAMADPFGFTERRKASAEASIEIARIQAAASAQWAEAAITIALVAGIVVIVAMLIQHKADYRQQIESRGYKVLGQTKGGYRVIDPSGRIAIIYPPRHTPLLPLKFRATRESTDS